MSRAAMFVLALELALCHRLCSANTPCTMQFSESFDSTDLGGRWNLVYGPPALFHRSISAIFNRITPASDVFTFTWGFLPRGAGHYTLTPVNENGLYAAVSSDESLNGVKIQLKNLNDGMMELSICEEGIDLLLSKAWPSHADVEREATAAGIMGVIRMY